MKFAHTSIWQSGAEQVNVQKTDIEMPVLGERIILTNYVLRGGVLFLLPQECHSLSLEPSPYWVFCLMKKKASLVVSI